MNISFISSTNRKMEFQKQFGCLKVICFFIFVQLNTFVSAELIVNIKNKGGDIDKEKIDANTTADTVILEYQPKDGTFITWFIDFKSEVQLMRVEVPWEEERGVVEPRPQVLCFVTKFGKSEFISSDAMSKLRQKNPTAVRTAEEDRGLEKHTLDLQMSTDLSDVLSHHIYNMCQHAPESTYTKESDVKILSQALNRDLKSMMSAMKRTELDKYSRCKDTTDILKPCFCQYQLCIPWYPCGLKYCRSRDPSGKVLNYRCGIKTCRRCFQYEHYAKQKKYCLWDDL